MWRALPGFVSQQTLREWYEIWPYRTAVYQHWPMSFTDFGDHGPEGQPAIEVMARSEDCQTVLLAEHFLTQRPVRP